MLNPVPVVLRFNDCITSRDLDGLAELMSDDHTFVDTEEGVVAGKQECLAAWRGFFDSFPDYRNVFASVTARGDVVTAVGHSVCAEPSLAGPAVWVATVRDGKVTGWRVCEDTPQTRRRFEIEG